MFINSTWAWACPSKIEHTEECTSELMDWRLRICEADAPVSLHCWANLQGSFLSLSFSVLWCLTSHFANSEYTTWLTLFPTVLVVSVPLICWPLSKNNWFHQVNLKYKDDLNWIKFDSIQYWIFHFFLVLNHHWSLVFVLKADDGFWQLC